MPVHYKPRKISQIAKTDSHIALVGKVTELGDNFFVLNDDTGSMEIISEETVEKDKLLRVFCSNVDGQWKADVMQDLKGLDTNLFKKVEELYSKAGV
jgi:hypothetical protein